MEKSFYESIAWYDYLVFLVYNGVFTYLLYRFGDVVYGLRTKTVSVFLLLFQLYFFTIIADSFFNFLPFLPDSELYAYMISSGQYPETSSENLIVLYYLSLFIGLICLNSPVIYTFFCCFVFINALMLFLKTWKIYAPLQKPEHEIIFPVMCIIWPSALLFNTSPLREAYILLGFALFFSGFVSYTMQGKWMQLLFGSIVLFGFRMQLFVFILPVLSILFISGLKIHKLLKFMIVTACVVSVYLFIRYALIAQPLTPELLAEYRNVNLLKAGHLAYGHVSWTTYVDMFSDYPFLIMQFLFSPLPIFVQHNPFSTLLPLLDLVFVIVLLMLFLRNIKTVLQDYKPLVFLLLFYLTLFGTYEYHITGAVRHRMPLEIFLMLPATSFLSKCFIRYYAKEA